MSIRKIKRMHYARKNPEWLLVAFTLLETLYL